MRLAVVSMIRNEADILAAFLAHCGALFDHAVLMDHGSIDATPALLRAACARRPGWRTWRIQESDFHPASCRSYAMRYLFETTDTDCVFFLDADEFIDVPDQASLALRLTGIPRGGYVHLYWRHVVPVDLSPRAVGFGDLLWTSGSLAGMVKVVVPRGCFDAHGGTLRVDRGCHGLVGLDDDTPFAALAELLHIPLRSRAQAQRKFMLGAFVALGDPDRSFTESTHWIEAAQRIAYAAPDDDDVRGFVAGYSANLPHERLTETDLAARGYTCVPFSVAHAWRPRARRVTAPEMRAVFDDMSRRWTGRGHASVEWRLEGDVLRQYPLVAQAAHQAAHPAAHPPTQGGTQLSL